MVAFYALLVITTISFILLIVIMFFITIKLLKLIDKLSDKIDKYKS